MTLILALGAGANAMGQLASNASLFRQMPARRQGLSFGVKQAAIPLGSLLAGAAVPLVALANALGTFLVDSAVARGIAPGSAGLALTLGLVSMPAAASGR